MPDWGGGIQPRQKLIKGTAHKPDERTCTYSEPVAGRGSAFRSHAKDGQGSRGPHPSCGLFTDLPAKHPTLPPTHNTALDFVTPDPH